MSKKIKAIIVEDEELAVKNLENKLQRNCPQVEIIGVCENAEEAIVSISQKEPDLVFLDVDLGSLNGFDVLKRLQYMEFGVIFITNTRAYALDAIKEDLPVMDFLEKPIDEVELIEAVNKVWGKIKKNGGDDPAKIRVPIMHGYKFLDIEEIVYCEADNNKTIFHMYNNRELVVSKVLRSVEEELSSSDFMRIHRKYLIHRLYLKEFNRTDGGYVIMVNDQRLPVSRGNFGVFG